jgi:hypothetical protein
MRDEGRGIKAKDRRLNNIRFFVGAKHSVKVFAVETSLTAECFALPSELWLLVNPHS